MKRILSFLLCIIFLKAQAFAIHGPLEGSDTGVILVGTYSGTLIPEDADQGTREFDLNTGVQTGTINSIGLFTVAIPSSGIGTGSFLIFTEGRSFSGTVTAVGNPNEGSLAGILEATYDYVGPVLDDNGNPVKQTTTTTVNGVTTTSTTTQTTTYTAAIRGSITAKVISSISNISSISVQTSNFGQIEGTAETGSMLSDPNSLTGELITGQIVRYKVDGVKQSLTADTATQLAGLGSDTTGNNNNLGLLGGLLLGGL